MNNASVEMLKKNLDEIPDLIKVEQQKIISNSIKKETLMIAMATQERIATLDVIMAKDESGKYTYTNDTARKAAIDDTLAHNPDYTKVRLDLLETNKAVMEAQMELDYQKNRFKALQYIVELIKLEESK